MIRKNVTMDYCGVRIFKDLKNTLTKMLDVFNIERISEMVSGNRFSLEIMQSSSHVQLLRAIFELQEIVNFFEKTASREMCLSDLKCK